MIKKLFCLFFLLCLLQKVYSQSAVKDTSISFIFTGIGYGAHIPAGDLSDRFGISNIIHGMVSYKFKNNWMLTAQGGFIFGNDIKESDILTGIETSDGSIIGQDGKLAEVRFFERGYHASLGIGKIFPFKKPNPNSGVMISFSAGFIQHKINIDPVGGSVANLSDDYLKGYDRLTNGLELHEFIGYTYFGNRRLINFFAGFDFIQAFTKNRRDYNFDQMKKDDRNRLDILNGFIVGWVLPLYTKPDKYYYN